MVQNSNTEIISDFFKYGVKIKDMKRPDKIRIKQESQPRKINRIFYKRSANCRTVSTQNSKAKL